MFTELLECFKYAEMMLSVHDQRAAALVGYLALVGFAKPPCKLQTCLSEGPSCMLLVWANTWWQQALCYIAGLGRLFCLVSAVSCSQPSTIDS
jgi:hypothetical protein